MAPDSMDLVSVVSPDGGLWIRRQVFEHSASSATLLSSPSSSDIDFPALARALSAASALPPPSPPAVPYPAYTAILAAHARLPPATADLIVEALETNAPCAFVCCNDSDNLAPGRQVDYRGLLIPVPELIAFMLLHVASANASRYRQTADSVWPAPDAAAAVIADRAPADPDAPRPPDHVEHQVAVLQASQAAALQAAQPAQSPLSHSPHRPFHQQALPPNSPPPTISAAPPEMLTLNLSPLRPDAPVTARKKSATPPSPALNRTSSIVASVSHSLQKETHLVASNISDLLTAIAACYGEAGTASNGTRRPRREQDDDDDDDDEENIDHRKDILKAKAKARDALTGADTTTMNGSTGGGGERTAEKSDVMISRPMLESLSFLLTTAASADCQQRLPISSIVPEWRDPACTHSFPLPRLVELTTKALTTMSADPCSGPVDTAEIRSLERKTIIRRSVPGTSVNPTDFPHGREVRITDCSEANIYLVCSLGRVSLIGCNDCTLFVGSCVSISAMNCNRVRIHTIARVCRVTNCFDSHLYVCTNRRPQLVGDCRGIHFAPYNAIYPCIARELAAVGVDPSRNTWNQFYRPATSLERSGDDDIKLSPAVVCELPPEKFLPFAVPVRAEDCGGEGSSAAVHDSDDDASSLSGDAGPSLRLLFRFEIPLPAEYATVIDERRLAVEALTRGINALPAEIKLPLASDEEEDDEMSDLPTSPEPPSGSVTPPSGVSSAPARPPVSMREHTKHAIEERFRSWLISSGNMRQFSDLVRLSSPEVLGEAPPPSSSEEAGA